jgi:hypothetical protein
MPKFNMIAELAGFELSRSTNGKPYTYAWCVLNEDGTLVNYGFAGSVALAWKGADAVKKWGRGRVSHVGAVTIYDAAAFKAWLVARRWRIYRDRPDGKREMINLSGNLPYRFKTEEAARAELATWPAPTDSSRFLVLKVN